MNTPSQKPTKPEMQRVDPIVELTSTIKAGFAASDANDSLIIGELKALQARVASLESQRAQDQARIEQHSGGIKELARVTSQHDLSHEAKLAELETQVRFWRPLFARLGAVLDSPRAVKLAIAVYGLVMGWLAARK